MPDGNIDLADLFSRNAPLIGDRRVGDASGGRRTHINPSTGQGQAEVVIAGAREIDAAGQYVSPGWIDMMDQSGGILPRNGLAEN